MSERETVLWMWVQGLGLNLSGLALLAAAGTILGPVGWTGTGVAVMLKLIGDGQLVRGYWLWQSQQRQLGSQSEQAPINVINVMPQEGSRYTVCG